MSRPSTSTCAIVMGAIRGSRWWWIGAAPATWKRRMARHSSTAGDAGRGSRPGGRRRARAGGSHGLGGGGREDTAEPLSPKPQPSVRDEEAPRQMSEMETREDPQRVTRWLGESHHMLDRAIPALIEDRDRLRQTLETREHECGRLPGELGELRRNLGALQGDLERLHSERATMAEAFGTVVELLGRLQRPLDEIARRLHAAQPVAVDTSAA